MAWTSMHFAVGMAGGAAIAGTGMLIARRGWRWLPAAMTAGGVWALVPDLPRIWREDFPSLPFASILGGKSLERWLDSVGNVFFFHTALDAQPREFALHGIALMILLYNAGIAWLLVGDWLSRRRRPQADSHAAAHRLIQQRDGQPPARRDAA